MAAIVETQTLPENLHEWEDQQELAMAQAEELGQEYTPAPLLLPTKADVERALARVAFFKAEEDETAAVFDDVIAQREAELKALKERRDAALRPWQRRQGWYLMALEQAARAALKADAKAKTQVYPSGTLVLRAQQPEWSYGDETALGKWLMDNAPQYVKPAPVKTDLKKAVTILRDGSVVLADSGEIIPGITVTPRDPKFELKIG